jgi:tRNA pseudouridine55 synthase
LKPSSQKNYFLNINKPAGISSSKVVAIVKKITKANKVGHAGTLDPFATGVLPIAVNKATKTIDHLINSDKKYYFRISWREFRTTDDIEGEVEDKSDFSPSNYQITAIIPFFVGSVIQIPSKFSAIKINGNRAYDLARNKKDFEMKKREVRINHLKMISNCEKYADFEVFCSKGFYVRTLARDICLKISQIFNIKICGYVSILRRIEVGNFYLDSAISLEMLKEVNSYDFSLFDGYKYCLVDVLNFMNKVELSDPDFFKFKNGQVLNVKSLNFITNSKNHISLAASSDNFLAIYNDEEVGIGNIKNDLFYPTKVF